MHSLQKRELFIAIALSVGGGIFGSVLVIYMLVNFNLFSLLTYFSNLSFNNLNNQPIIIQQPREVNLSLDVTIENIINQRIRNNFW